MNAQLLEVDARAIKFVCEVKKQSSCSVHLTNVSDHHVAFKVKTTSPKKFCVRPNAGIINPKSECDFTVTMQALRSIPLNLECKDKFLIQSTVVSSDTSEDDITLEMFSKGSDNYTEEKRLRVILLIQHDSSNEALIKEEKLGNIDENSPIKLMQNEDVREVKDALTKEKEDTEKKLKLRNEIKDLRLKANALELQLREAKTTISNQTYQNSIIIEAKETLKQELVRRRTEGFSFLSVCLVSFVGLSIGYLSHP